MSSTRSFEWLRTSLAEQPRSVREDVRDLIWADDQKSLAVSRDATGGIEIFIVGGPLRIRTTLLAKCLQHQMWRTSGETELRASRLVLPEAANLPGVAAFICAELLANGLAVDPQSALARTESVIVMLLQREEMGNQVLVGLAGELLLVEALCRNHSTPDAVVAAWAGHVPSSRDLQLGTLGVEVKATTGTSSIHTVQGFHQVEVGHPTRDEPETALYLLSVGFRWLPIETDGGTSIPDLVDAIVNRLTPDAATLFLARLRQYGGDAGLGYDHDRHRQEPRLSRRLLATFERLYDMTDDRIRVMRSQDVEGITHIDPSSVSFRIALPRQVDGDVNPLDGIEMIAKHLLEVA